MSDDITRIILEDHETFRRAFADLDDLSHGNEPTALTNVWQPLADLLDVHAIAEEEIFYPQLLERGSDDAPEETLDAIGDHNDIRDGVRDAAEHPAGSKPWWDAVTKTREANDEHMAEEEGEGLVNFRRHTAMDLREKLGREFRTFKAEHPGTAGLDTSDKDPEEYLREEAPAAREP